MDSPQANKRQMPMAGGVVEVATREMLLLQSGVCYILKNTIDFLSEMNPFNQSQQDASTTKDKETTKKSGKPNLTQSSSHHTSTEHLNNASTIASAPQQQRQQHQVNANKVSSATTIKPAQQQHESRNFHQHNMHHRLGNISNNKHNTQISNGNTITSHGMKRQCLISCLKRSTSPASSSKENQSVLPTGTKMTSAKMHEESIAQDAKLNKINGCKLETDDTSCPCRNTVSDPCERRSGSSSLLEEGTTTRRPRVNWGCVTVRTIRPFPNEAAVTEEYTRAQRSHSYGGVGVPRHHLYRHNNNNSGRKNVYKNVRVVTQSTTTSTSSNCEQQTPQTITAVPTAVTTTSKTTKTIVQQCAPVTSNKLFQRRMQRMNMSVSLTVGK